MSSLTVIFILNCVFFVSFFLVRNIYISFVLTVLSLFLLLFISRNKEITVINSFVKLPKINLSNNHYINALFCLIAFIILEKIIGFNASLLTSFFIFSYLNKLDNRAGFLVALIFLALTFFFTADKNKSTAEATAIMTYYFLVIAVVWYLFQLLKEKFEVFQYKPLFKVAPFRNFLTMKNIFITGFSFTLCIILLYTTFVKSTTKKNFPPTLTPVPTISISPKTFKHIPLAILNGTEINGLAASTAALLRKAGWKEEEFDILIGNNNASASANILKYTSNLKSKKTLLERNLKIRVTPIILKDASREAEMTLILGK